MHAVAQKLHDRGIEVRWPKYGDSRRLAIVNARDARSEITAEDCGYVTWDYWPRTGPGTDAADLAATVLDVLGAHVAAPVPAARGVLTLKGAVGRALKDRGLNVSVAVYQDDVAFDATTEIVAANPAVPSCGQVRVTDDGCITWECHHDGPPAECALAVADTIVPILTHGIGTGAGSAVGMEVANSG
jgi:hypothetical protein